MKLAKLVEIDELGNISIEKRTHNLTKLFSGNLWGLLSGKSEIVIGRRDRGSSQSTRADIFLGEDENGELNTLPRVIYGISRRQARIIYNSKTGTYYLEDCSTHKTTKVNGEFLSIGEQRALKSGDRLSFGNHNYGPVIFRQED
ncbi:MAG TPA: FHA domain-containing protein [Candidatus Nanoarchaeia archaeon]|nr:FHA domain-containing protein [Candidatus Nanoarchaeia archaeon]